MNIIINVQNTGKLLVVKVTEQTTLEKFRAKICEITEIIPIIQTLKFMRNEMTDELKTLEEIGLENEDTVMLLVRKTPDGTGCDGCDEVKALWYCPRCDENLCSCCLKYVHKLKKKKNSFKRCYFT